MTLLVISPDYASHLYPLLTLASAWDAAGERVVVATGDAVAPLVERAGFERVPLLLGRGSNAGTARVEDQPTGEDVNLRAFFDATYAGMIPTLRLQAELRRNDLLWRPEEAARATIEVVHEVAPDAILVDHLAFGATLGLGAAGIPYTDVVLGHPSALTLPGERYGVPTAWPVAFDPDPRELAALEQVADQVSAQFTEDWNEAQRALDAGSLAVDDAFRVHGETVLFNYPEALHDPHRTARLPNRHAFLGFAARDEELDAEAAAWLAVDPDRPLVVVSFGSFLSERADVLAKVAAGLAGTGVRVAMATGSADPARLGDQPGDWLIRPFLPQVALMRHASVAITHAGNNGVTEALSFGVPVLALPFSTDQFAVAADLERVGLGRAADPNQVTPGQIRNAVLALLDGSERAAAGSLGQSLRADPGPARARRLQSTVIST
ncbi:MAG: glycosyltransferase [Candidatus Limnocylindrales bacterium]